MVAKTCFVDDEDDYFACVCMSGYSSEYDMDEDFMDGQTVRDVISEIESCCQELEERKKEFTDNCEFISYLEAWREVFTIAQKHPDATIRLV